MQFLQISTLLLTLLPWAAAQAPPTTMTRLSIRAEGPEIPKDSFAAKPKTLFRAGAGFCRIDELPDPANGIHGLIIINEPDIWMVNLHDHSARHFVDEGPTYNCRLPVFEGDLDPAKNPLLGLEFGREFAFFEAHQATAEDGPELGGIATTTYRTTVDKALLVLFTPRGSKRPLAVARSLGKTREIVWYITFDELPFDPKLFAKPTGVTIEEAQAR